MIIASVLMVFLGGFIVGGVVCFWWLLREFEKRNAAARRGGWHETADGGEYYDRTEGSTVNLSLKTRKALGAAASLVMPGYSTCHRCFRPWSICDGHVTNYSRHRGCFPLCTDCWGELTPSDRLQFYRQLWNEWRGQGHKDDSTWEQIEAAVLAGK